MDILDIDETLDIDDLTNEYEVMMICKTPPVRPVMFVMSQLLTPLPTYEVLALTSPWTPYTGFTFGAAIDREGRVQLLGNISGGSSGSTVITLPELYRPAQRVNMVIATEDGYGRIYIRTTGVVTIAYSGSGWCALDSVSYHTQYQWHSEE
jgi:hypothetical protein